MFTKIKEKYSEIKNFSNGEFFEGKGDKYEVYSPINEEIIGTFKTASVEQLDEVVEKAKKAQNEWGSLTFKARSQVLYKYRELLVKYREEISEINSVENGKNMAEAYAGVDKAIELTDFACSMPQLISEKTEEVSRGVVCKEIRKPLGVVASITPFNFPVMVPNWTIPNSIVLGNAIILKPSELTPISAMKMAELWKEAGLPDGIFNVVNGGKEIVERICDHENIAAVSFVGSTPVAKIVHERCSKNGKRVLALGGAKNHITVMPDVNVEAGSRDIIASAFGMSGQRCMAASVIIGVGNVQEILNSVVEKAKEMKAGEDLPPLVTKVAVQKIIDYIEFAEKNGGKILVDGREKMSSENSCLIGPTIIEWSESSNMGKTEVFGPLLEFVKADSLEEAIKIQNRSPYGNAASIFTQNGRIADEAIKGFQAGMLGINIGVPVPREPFSFGGIKDSKFGYGDITGESSINFWTNLIKLTTKWNAENKVDWMS